MTRVLVTGAGGPAGVAVIRSLLRRGDVDVVAADMDRWASGLYLVQAGNRRLVPAGRADDFVDVVRALCRDEGVDVLFPTVDVELPRLAAVRDELAAAGTLLASPSLATIETCLDKLALAAACRGTVRVPRTELLGTPQALGGWQFPVIVKPRRGAGSRGVRTVRSATELDAVHAEEDLLVQELLPGDEYSVDVLAAPDGHVVAAVPRARMRVDSGVAVAGVTLHDDELVETASAVARAVGLTSVANVQLKRDADGAPALLEVNPRFPGAMPLTIASGVDMPSLVLDAVLGRPVPDRVAHRAIANVRYLEDVFLPVEDVLGRR
ncbi:ATP-grasp domain-containing protein [Cellulomonas shaoxiangyii]|uniref:ATP-grasp domain-containing protein n=1 Tax=Cellulomonas shaoxiangyii TaxID=2566013 RepID=A0A4V1CMU2_9CELL|nr:ATP-grasp domain-containing protein [Cellulomonas shaoxiangyii]QCB94135.1 ATP-grasp domain-containing protein [Cellulomonas shaoxiangyii]TGY86628.1 ATP-grasp domain-containing protein [Cellulomonas shaoxiangyii]